MTVRFPRFPWEGLLVCVLHSSFSAVSLKPSRSTHRASASVSNYTFERAGLPARPSRLMGQSSTRACSGSDERSATSRSVHILRYEHNRPGRTHRQRASRPRRPTRHRRHLPTRHPRIRTRRPCRRGEDPREPASHEQIGRRSARPQHGTAGGATQCSVASGGGIGCEQGSRVPRGASGGVHERPE